MEARIKNPATYITEAMEPLQALAAAPKGHGVPDATLELTHLRASQINGCAWCLDYGYRNAKKAGETDERLATIAGWREAPYFDDAEKAALALTEEITRLADSSDPVPDAVWDEAAKHYDEEALAALVIWVSMTNLWNRLNVSVRQVAGTWT
ncbi:carboxymuconolactone decarboxylase family protein [Luteipulveratus flavus]|uniref:Carboxymuconolactone decarboxylase family protein n=1 Tax=Luteipulveratus flavus TaxID=3031728 RepID=A0ABT6C9M8_9MICO|nr:carboxymuconolactone decarboxylase family protein [Luteipulveratus sp. YIM 133296]MDF8265606.1 carboxymuconolactone decarboxylase family protein [Luteipulveratus sp. YIM 133296]